MQKIYADTNANNFNDLKWFLLETMMFQLDKNNFNCPIILTSF